MKKRLFNVLKIFLMILGALFLVQLLIILGAVIGFTSFANADFAVVKQDVKLKTIQPVIDYVEDYRSKNGKYPSKVENVKVKKDLEYKYEVAKDFNCYTITVKSQKENLIKKYQHCFVEGENSSSNSQSYVEYSE